MALGPPRHAGGVWPRRTWADRHAAVRNCARARDDLSAPSRGARAGAQLCRRFWRPRARRRCRDREGGRRRLVRRPGLRRGLHLCPPGPRAFRIRHAWRRATSTVERSGAFACSEPMRRGLSSRLGLPDRLAMHAGALRPAWTSAGQVGRPMFNRRGMPRRHLRRH
jgi:hypothetical protein